MTHPIHSSPSGLHVYRQQSNQSPSPSTEKSSSSPANTLVQDELHARAEANGISRDEQQMIEQYFPETEKTLRLYSPDQGTHEVNPDALGSRLDVHG